MISLVLAQENGVWQPMLYKDGFFGLTQFFFEPVYLQNGDIFLVERYMFNERILRVNPTSANYSSNNSTPYFTISEVFPYRTDIARPLCILPTTAISCDDLNAFKYTWSQHLEFLNTQKLRFMEMVHWANINPSPYNIGPYVLTSTYDLHMVPNVSYTPASSPLAETVVENAAPEGHTSPISLDLDLDLVSHSSVIDLEVDQDFAKLELDFTPVHNRKKKGKSPRPKSPFVAPELKPKTSLLQLLDVDEQDHVAIEEIAVSPSENIAEETLSEIIIPDSLISKICDIIANKLEIKSDETLYNELESYVASGADINRPDKFKQNLLDYAVRFRNLKATRELVEEFYALARPDMLAEFKSASDAESYTMLFYLFHLVFIDNTNRLNLALYKLEQMQPRPPVEMALLMVQFLLANGADINCMTSANQHLLHSAVIRADYEVIEYLLEIMHKSDVEKYINHQDDFGQTALFAAMGRREPKIVLLLLKHGADPKIATLKGTKPIDRLRKQIEKSGLKPERCDFEIAQALGEALFIYNSPKAKLMTS